MKKWFFHWLDGLFPHTSSSETPCPHMKETLSEMSDDTLTGVKRWYALQHVAGCPGCSRTLQRLRALRDRLRGLRPGEQSVESSVMALTPEQRARVEAAWAQIDSKH